MYIMVFNKNSDGKPSIAISNDLDFIFYAKDEKLSCTTRLRFSDIGVFTAVYQTKFNVPLTWFDTLTSELRKVDNNGFAIYNFYRTNLLKIEATNDPLLNLHFNDNSVIRLITRFQPGTIIRHFKRELVDNGTTEYLYMYIGEVRHTETNEELILYSSLYTDKSKGIDSGNMFVRPKYQFLGLVDKEKYPHIRQEFRFEATTLNVGKDI